MAYLKIIRPLNVLLTFISVWLAAFISPYFSVTPLVGLAALSAAFILAGANVINDIYDFEIDRVNRPARPLASGALSIKQAWRWFVFLYAAGLLAAIAAGVWFFSIAAVIAGLLIWYSTHLKRTVLFGNILVSIAAGLTFIFGALAVHDWQAGVIPAVFAFFFHLGREIIKDMQDMEGDLQNNAVTFPGKFGFKVAAFLINILFGLLLLLTLLPYIFSIYSEAYLWIVIPGVDAVLLFVMISLWSNSNTSVLGRLSSLLKIDMFVGLTAIWVGTHYATFFN